MWTTGTTAASVGPLPGTDLELSRAVEERLDRDRRLRQHPLRVEAHEGRILLSGTVPDLAARRQAIRLAASQRRVLAVEGRLAVRGGGRADRALRLRVRLRVSFHTDLASPRLVIVARNGLVEVAGQVATVGRYLFLRIITLWISSLI